MKLNTETIIENCRKGDVNAFRLLVESFSDFAFSVAFRILNDEEESKDVIQESFISVWKGIGHFDRERHLKNWLYTIVVNKCLDCMRKKKRMAWIHPKRNDWDVLELISENNPETIIQNKEIGRLIRSLTSKLSQQQKVVFVLSELEGLTHDDISEITGLGKASVKSNLNHARRNIGKMIEKLI